MLLYTALEIIRRQFESKGIPKKWLVNTEILTSYKKIQHRPDYEMIKYDEWCVMDLLN